ncbi:MAG: hypothetical protein U0457_15235 [Candidatus Sericytochromatia bacterium]
MKKLKALILCSFLLFSCNIPLQKIDVKIPISRLNYDFDYISSICTDKNDNIYIIENNQIKKIDSKTNEITLIAGKIKPDNFASAGDIDGEISKAKFGDISSLFFSDSENSLYFFDRNIYETKKSLESGKEDDKIYYSQLRNINNNKVKTFSDIGNINIIFSKNGKSYFYLFNESILYQFDREPFSITKKIVIPDKSFIRDTIIDNEGNIYLTITDKLLGNYDDLYVSKNNSWFKIIDSDNDGILTYFLNKSDDLYVIKEPVRINSFTKEKLLDYYMPSSIYKIPKRDIKDLKMPIKLNNFKYHIGFLDSDISFNGYTGDLVKYFADDKNLYIAKSSEQKMKKNYSLYKIKIGD